jgi:hypothetical protein
MGRAAKEGGAPGQESAPDAGADEHKASTTTSLPPATSTSEALDPTIDAYEQTAKGKAKRAAYRRSARGKKAQAEARARYNASPRGKAQNAAMRAVRKAEKAKQLPPAHTVPCELGPDGCSGRMNWHHRSYLVTDWLNVRALCTRHHSEVHRLGPRIHIPTQWPPTPDDRGELR